MNKAESKYFNTARRMDQALLELLETKEFEYITIKEICSKAEVNRSTFYLHYETLGDLLEETIQYKNELFFSYFPEQQKGLAERISTAPMDQLFLLTEEYLMPYLNYVRENRKLFQISFSKAQTVGSKKMYKFMLDQIMNPILNRFSVPIEKQQYILAFYMEGVIAMIKVWVRGGCAESPEVIAQWIIGVVKQANMGSPDAS